MFRTLSTATLLGLLTISAASAQNLYSVDANIPFDFSIANHVMNAGRYTVAYNHNGVLTVQGLDTHSKAAFVMARPAGGPAVSGPGKLVFDCYRGACSLGQVLPGTDVGGQNVRIPEPAVQERMAMQTRVVPVLIAKK
ncbi:MAG TPA: hypothetical protein VFA04_10655 [Bryobacteraceae bacterium]|jgi:hypothetical protein|nr:hypothetical protein [Bryobacteraceae bacterium]